MRLRRFGRGLLLALGAVPLAYVGCTQLQPSQSEPGGADASVPGDAGGATTDAGRDADRDAGTPPGYGSDAAIDAGIPADPTRVFLKDWKIQSSAVATDPGATISTAAYAPANWYATTAPSTVLAALVNAGVYGDVLTGMNFRSIPGTTYPIGKDFLSINDDIPMPQDSPFAPGWWFRAEFQAPSSSAVTLHFDGISYKANVFLNGKSVATSADVLGTYRRFDFDVGGLLVAGTNAVAVEVTAQEPADLGLDFVDWNPAPADRYMGLLRDTYLVLHDDVEIRDPYVATHLSGASAALTVGAELHNAGAAAVTGTLEGAIEGVTFSQDMTLAAGETKEVAFDPAKVSQLTFGTPRLWWPAGLGGQDLYTLDLKFSVGGKVSHEAQIPFGIREITSELSGSASSRLFRINGKPIFIRGGGYTPDIFYRQDAGRQLAELTYVRDLNLNTVRLEGKLEGETFFDLADRMGILVMPGLMCCDYWQDSSNWVAGDFPIAAASVHDQAMRLRKHPSVLTFLYGSDQAPVSAAEQGYLDALQQAAWPNPIQAAASEPGTAPASGPTGYKMLGPYDYEPPIYWYTDDQHGGAFGFATEISPGADVPPPETLLEMLGPSHQWPVDDVWNFHAGAKPPFTDLGNFTSALEGRYGAAGGVDDFSMKSQLMAYESLRAMFEAYGRNKYTSATGVIQWMLNNAWPGLYWHLWDYYLRPGGAYFGAKKGNEFVHVQYSYDDSSIVVTNHTYAAQAGLTATATLLDVHSSQVFTASAQVNVPADGVTKTTLSLPAFDASNPVYFLDLELVDAGQAPVSSNVYWLTPKPDVMAAPDPSTAWYFQPVATFADFSPLSSLPQVTLKGTKSTQVSGSSLVTTVTLENDSSTVAFFTRVQVTSGGSEILPVVWSDGYVTLLPGAKKTLTATYDSILATAGTPAVTVSGWNVASQQL